MFPPLSLFLFCFTRIPSCFPLCKFSLARLALKKLLNLREQDASQSIYFMLWDACPVIVLLLFCHILVPFALCRPIAFIEQIALKDGAVVHEEAPLRVLGNPLGGVSAVEDDL